MTSEINAGVITQIVESIFATMMGTEVRQSDASWTAAGDRVTSSIFLEGAWNGAVTLECTRQQACSFAGQFLAMDAPTAVNDDVRDVLGELVNMIGGNMKSTLAEGTRLSMPSVVDGSNYELHVCGSGQRDTVAFAFDDGNFWVTILTKEDGALHDEPHAT